jgi:PHD/YefM family antitoxin component YafN of YafNO toxin-antitoxin module
MKSVPRCCGVVRLFVSARADSKNKDCDYGFSNAVVASPQLTEGKEDCGKLAWLLTRAVPVRMLAERTQKEAGMNAALDVRPKFIVDAKGRKKAVVIPFDAYEKLMEDLADLAAAAERREEKTLSHEQLLKELKDDGLLPA